MTYIIIFVTVAVSIACFMNRTLYSNLLLSPYMVWHRKQWYRLITHGFVHGDYAHLAINMFVLWSFGVYVEQILKMQQMVGIIDSPTLNYLSLYFGGMIAASIYDVFAKRDNPQYASIGASGAVSAIVFTTIFFDPLGKIYFFGVLPIPGIIFGLLYLAYEWYSTRRTDGVNHFAHLLGAVYGFVYPLLMSPSLIHTFLNGLKF